MKVEALALLLLAGISVSSAFVAPAFCRESDCPTFRVIRQTDDYELREYEPSKWIAASGGDSQRGIFMKLFRYINGANRHERKISMTVPVLKEFSMTGDDFVNANVMAFFTELTSPPTPNESSIEIVELPRMRVYVRTYGWWSTDAKVAWHLQQLKDSLPAGVEVDTSRAYFAGYDSPWVLTDRHNEVWLVQA